MGANVSCPFPTNQSDVSGFPPGGRPPRSEMSRVTVYPKMWLSGSLAEMYFPARPITAPSSTSQSMRSRPQGRTMDSPFPITAPRLGFRKR